MFRRPALPFFHPVTLIATWFGSGLIKGIPGTWGSLAALPFAVLIAWLGGFWALLSAAIVAFLVGIWASERYAWAMGQSDPGPVVIDEVAGQWLALALLPLDPVTYLVGFVTFRAFDIVKPWPASWLDRSVKGGLGIMADDMVAGAYAGIVSYGLTLWLLKPMGMTGLWTW
jgi:phosphatidylglycerophosphatase A